MRRLPTLTTFLPLTMLACGGGRYSYAASPSSPAPPPAVVSAAGYDASYRDEAAAETVAYRPTMAPRATVEASASYGDETVAVAQSGSSATSSAVAAGPSAPVAVAGPAAVEMLDVEAHVTIEVEKVADGIVKLRELVRARGGSFVGEAVVDESGSSGGTFTLRIASRDADKFLAALDGVGRVRQRQVAVRDVGKEYFDASLQLTNFEAALARYQEILQKATTVAEMIQIEHELTRLKGEIERVKGAMRFMRDRVAQATIYVSIITHHPDIEPPFNPSAKLYPGLRAGFTTDLRGSDGNRGYVGAGISVRGGRYFSVDLDVARRTGAGFITGGADLLLLTIGGEFYSDFLGAGRRSYLNPYIGFRGGYSRMLGVSEVALGGTVGVELVRTQAIALDFDLRALGLFGTEAGAHVAIQPQLGLNIAF